MKIKVEPIEIPEDEPFSNDRKVSGLYLFSFSFRYRASLYVEMIQSNLKKFYSMNKNSC